MAFEFHPELEIAKAEWIRARNEYLAAKEANKPRHEIMELWRRAEDLHRIYLRTPRLIKT